MNQQTTPLNIAVFDESAETWSFKSSQEGPLPGWTAPTELRIATFNVWFEAMHADVRLPAIYTLLADLDVDVICLQEVTDDILQGLMSDKRLHGYHVVGHDRITALGSWYGTVILCRLGIERAYAVSLPSIYSRELLVIELGQGFRVVASHLDSPSPIEKSNLEAMSLREEQLEIVKSLGERTIFCADTNLLNEQDDVPHKLGLRDAWLELHKPQATWGISYPNQFPPTRFDRILINDSRARVTRASLFGQQTVDNDKYPGEKVYPSDHFGVIAVFTYDS